MLTLLIRCCRPPEYGNAGWAAGVNQEDEEKPVAGDNQMSGGNQDSKQAADAAASVGSAEGWSAVQKALFFFAVLGAVGLYIRMGKRSARDVAHEKSLV